MVTIRIKINYIYGVSLVQLFEVCLTESLNLGEFLVLLNASFNFFSRCCRVSFFQNCKLS